MIEFTEEFLVRCIVHTYADIRSVNHGKHRCEFDDKAKRARFYQKGYFKDTLISEDNYEHIISEFMEQGEKS